MTRETFDHRLRELKAEVRLLGNMVEEAVLGALAALQRRDIEAARTIYHGDIKINQRRFTIESEVLTLIALQQPLAHDLRLIAAVLEVITDLERMGDYAKSIAKLTVNVGDDPLLKMPPDMPAMVETGVKMLTQALDAFVLEDVQAASRSPDQDNEVDDLFDQVKLDLSKQMLANAASQARATDLLLIAHNMERFADRVCNICERTIFMVTGRMREFDEDTEAGKLKH